MTPTPWVSYLILGIIGIIIPIVITLWVLIDDKNDRKKTQALKRENNIND